MYKPTTPDDFERAYNAGERNFDLSGYAHPLPAGLTTTGYLELSGYAHPLPAGLKRR